MQRAAGPVVRRHSSAGALAGASRRPAARRRSCAAIRGCCPRPPSCGPRGRAENGIVVAGARRLHRGLAERQIGGHPERSPVAVERRVLLGAGVRIEPALGDDPAQQPGIEPSRARVLLRRGDRGVDVGAVVLQPLDLVDVAGKRDIVDRSGGEFVRRCPVVVPFAIFPSYAAGAAALP
jgi:hypothetical protein